MNKKYTVYYFDFEASTNGEKHIPYCVCLSNSSGTEIKTYYGKGCARKMLNYLPNYSLCYAHNLSYDINFIIDLLNVVYSKSIIKGSKVYMIAGKYNGKSLTFKDSLCVISSPLRLFPSMFNLETGRKECFPYGYYQSFIQKIKYFDEDELKIVEREIYTVPGEIGIIEDAIKYIDEEDKDLFIDNVRSVAYIDEKIFSMKRYCIFYCLQDVRILREGFETFRKLLLEQFDLDAYEYISISSIAHKLIKLKCYIPNGNIYELANKPRDFISKCIIGGRCMLSDNTKRIVKGEIVDFDAVSLYPSAIARLYLLEGIPKILKNEMLNQNYLLEHLFTDEQIEPTDTKFISGFFIEGIIKKINKPLHFPIIVSDGEIRSCNKCGKMFMDHITFEDLINFQGCEIEIIRGYYYDGKRDISCRNTINELFDLRNKYKKEGNPLQVIIKLLLNSIYGKTILKPIDTKLKFITKDELERYIYNRYGYIQEIIQYGGGNKIMVKEYKEYSKHFSLVPFGVNILSMSKRIMCEVMANMERLGLDIFYTDTDSFFTYKENLDIIDREYKNIYGRNLIGTSLGQFHPDLESINGDNKVIGTYGIFIMKKCYIVQLINSSGDIAFHVRMKGIPIDVIVNRANELYKECSYCYVSDGLVYPIEKNKKSSIIELYENIYNGEIIEFDLVKGNRPRFEIKIGNTITKESFIRRIGLNVNP